MQLFQRFSHRTFRAREDWFRVETRLFVQRERDEIFVQTAEKHGTLVRPDGICTKLVHVSTNGAV